MNGRAVDCDLSDAHYARDARWHIAQSLGAAIAKVELVVAGAALDDYDILDDRDIQIVLSDRRVEQELAEAANVDSIEELVPKIRLCWNYARISTLPESIRHFHRLRDLEIIRLARWHWRSQRASQA